MTTKQWYQVLLEDRLLTDNSPDTLIPTPVEILHPTVDWTETWRLSRIAGFGSDLIAFVFKNYTASFPLKTGSQEWV